MQYRIKELAQKVCEELNLYLIEVRIRGDQRNPIFEVFADSELGITLGQCEELTRKIQDELDISDFGLPNYRLNVSSPGVDRALEFDFEYKKNIGKNLIIKLQRSEDEDQITGKLTDFNEDELELEVDGSKRKIARNDVTEAKVKIQW
jgi:ribosome maturation factor RimP